MFDSQLPHKVLSADAQIFILDLTFFLLLEAVRNIAGFEFDWQRDGRLLLLPRVFVWYFARILSILARRRITRTFEDVAFTLESPDWRDAAFDLGLDSSAADMVAHGPVPNVDELLFMCFSF